MLEQHDYVDDSLLPSAFELEKLKEIDPSIIEWILKRAEKEQDIRLEFNTKGISLAEYNLRKTHRFNFTALAFGFILFLVILGLSAFFIIQELPVAGTVFGGTAIATAALFFLKVIIKPKSSVQ